MHRLHYRMTHCFLNVVLGPEDTDVTRQNKLVPALPSKMTMVLRLVARQIASGKISKYSLLHVEPCELEQSIDKSSVDHKVEDLVKLDDYDTECVSKTGWPWSELEHWMCLLNS